MRHKRYERHGFTDTSRKREALPLFAEQIAEAQPSEDAVMEARAAQWDHDQARWRAAPAMNWRRDRRKLAALSSNERTALTRAWNGVPYPADSMYLLDFLHGYSIGRFTLDTLPFESRPRDPHGRRLVAPAFPET